MSQKAKGFGTEEALGRAFKASRTIKRKLPYCDWKSWEARELQGLFGVPDHLVVLWNPRMGGRRILRVVSFEIKKEKWQRALVQAYRYLAFSDYSCVVMDHAFVHRAVAQIEQFRRSNVGLLSVSSDGSVEWHYVPKCRRPYSDSARKFLHDTLLNHLFKTARPRGGPTIKWK
jgi:hypothetical protein